MSLKLILPYGARYIIDNLCSCGFEAYVVGGCVRDALLNKEPHDWDICTAAHPNTVSGIFRDNVIVPTGIRHGTLSIVSNDGKLYEVTTFRVDGAYSDHRRPDTVSFTPSLEQDLARRDFTINAMAYNDRRGLLDPFGGCSDLGKKLIRCVGSADERFQEDALRIMRALRFASVYGFSIEQETSAAIHRNKGLLYQIAVERINAELCRLICGSGALPVLLDYGDVIAEIVPEFAPCIGFDQKNRYHVYTIYEHIMRALDGYKGGDMVTKLALFFHDIGKPDCYTEDERGGHFHGHGVVSAQKTDDIMTRLRFDNETKRLVTELVLYHDSTIEPTGKVVRRWLNKIGPEQFGRLLDVREADMRAHAPDTFQSRLERNDSLRALFGEIVEENACFSLKNLAINGDDVMSFGVPQGKCVGDLLGSALEKVINNELPNEKEALMSYIKELWMYDKV